VAALCDHPAMARTRRLRGVWLISALALVLAGCGTTSLLHHGASKAAGTPVGQDGPPAAAAKVAVVRHWAADLRAGDLQGAAGYFRLPSIFDNGVASTVHLQTLAQAEFVNSTLTCGAEVISAFRRGRLIDVLFRLTARAGRGGGARACGTGIGSTARTDFLIRDGKIVEWLRAPSLPGDPGTPSSSSSSTTQTSTASGPAV
jgi:hypothetical protein